jgi:hypothetical protein
MIVDLSQYKTEKELREFAERLVQTNLVLQSQLKEVENKKKHLEDLIKHNSHSLAIASNEEEICKIELGRLFVKCQQKPLEYSEAKLVELYTKTLLAIKGKDLAEKPKSKDTVKQYSPQELIEIALKSSPEDSEN